MVFRQPVPVPMLHGAHLSRLWPGQGGLTFSTTTTIKKNSPFEPVSLLTFRRVEGHGAQALMWRD